MSLSPKLKSRRRENCVEPPGVRSAAALTLLTVLCEALCVQSATIQFTKEPKSQDALHGRSAMLRCEVSDPDGITYSWLHDGQTVTNSERRFLEGGNLKFTAIDRTQDSGSFQCVASRNSTGETERTSAASFNIKWLESGAVTNSSTEAESGSSSAVTLHCNIDGHPRPTSRWYKDGTLLTEKNHSVNNKERTLRLPSASPDDNGVYYCCAKNAAGHVCSTSNFTLNIIDKSFPQPLIKPEDLVVLRNEGAHFDCQFTAEPQPTVEWFHGSEPIINKSRIFVLNNGSLYISQVKQRNTGRYKCVARGLHGPPVSLEASLNIAEIEDMQPRKSRVFTADSQERVACQPPNGSPKPEVWWERAGQRLPSEGRVYQDGPNLVFNPTRAEDSGVYTCFAQNKAGQRKQELTVTVATPPQWVQKPDEESQLEEGHAGYLHCYTRATPEPEVTWYRSMQPIGAEDLRFKQFPNGTLRINSVEVYDGHVYSCESKTEAGKLMANARVVVLERLKFTPTPQSLQCLELEKEGSLHCSAKGRLPPVIRWTKADGSEIPSRVRQTGGSLHFSEVTRSDAGNYTCLASNSLQGEIRAMVQLTVAVYVSFKLKPENSTVYQGHTAVLHCQATGDPSPIIQWKKKDKFLIGNKSRFQTMQNGSLVIHDVGTEDTGSYTCIAGNSCKIAHTTAELYVVEKPVQHSLADDERAPYKMIQTVGLSVGAAVAYIIVVLGLMFYCKQRRKAKRLQKDQDGEEPELECLNGGVQQNGQATSELPEEVPLTTTSSAGNNKRHSTHEKIHFPRASLHAITTLGRGEFGEVLLAKVKSGENEEETAVLVKSLQTRNEQLQTEFRRESEMFAKTCHPNVTRLLGMCREAEPFYMILEYADMGDLKQYLKISKSKDEKVKVQPLSTKQKVAVCLQVARGMEHLSNQRFVHRDLAARNCLISTKRQVKVSALGLSRDVYKSEYYHYHQAWIPLRWLPSEAVFEDDFSTKTDVWSFGVLMWEVFSFGELPHSDLEDDQVLEGLQEGKLKLPPPNGCPSRIYKLMLRCWASSPKDRVSFSDVVSALGDLPSESKV